MFRFVTVTITKRVLPLPSTVGSRSLPTTYFRVSAGPVRSGPEFSGLATPSVRAFGVIPVTSQSTSGDKTEVS